MGIYSFFFSNFILLFRLVSDGCHDKIPYDGLNNRGCLINWEVLILRPRCGQSWFLPRPLSGSLHARFSVCVCNLIPASYKDPSPMG